MALKNNENINFFIFVKEFLKEKIF